MIQTAVRLSNIPEVHKRRWRGRKELDIQILILCQRMGVRSSNLWIVRVRQVGRVVVLDRLTWASSTAKPVQSLLGQQEAGTSAPSSITANELFLQFAAPSIPQQLNWGGEKKYEHIRHLKKYSTFVTSNIAHSSPQI